jgi:hypothetical protein
MLTMKEYKSTLDIASNSNFREVQAKKSVFFLGASIIVAAIQFGNKFAFYVPFTVISILMTLIWKKTPRPWIFLVSIAAATPIAVSRQKFACNVVFAIWFALLNMRYLFKLPKWIYVPTFLCLLGFLVSSISWLPENPVGGLLREGAYAVNFILAPFILVPLIYFRMEKSRDFEANLKGLLFCLIIPSTLILLSAKLLGTVSNDFEASRNHLGGTEGFLMYRLGRVDINFLRTEVGFILSALICASSAIAMSQVKTRYKLVARACLVANIFLLFATGSVGSALSCLCGIGTMLYVQFRKISAKNVIVSVVGIGCLLLLTYTISPPSIKNYIGKRFEDRVTNKNDDRIWLWVNALHYYIDNPSGVGFTLAVDYALGGRKKAVIHNDYLAYTVSYSLLGGVAYTSLILGLIISFFKLGKYVSNDPYALAVYLAGLSVIVAAAINSMTDHMTENRWYFNLIWSVIWYSYFCSRAAAIKPIPDGLNAKPVFPNRMP